MTTTSGGVVFRKSLIAYLYTIVGTVLLAGFLGLVAAGLSGGAKTFVTLLVVAVLVRGAYRVAYLHSVTWTVLPEGLRIRGGILPWKALDWHNPWPALFESSYRHGFFGFVLNYGTCVVRRSEGVTTNQTENRMHDAKRLSGMINTGIANHRARMVPVAAPPPPTPTAAVRPDPVAGLTDLARLLANGDISRAEYDTLKARLINP
ncbi:hypothetical protein ASD62_13680 [Phycicoccus sp. Root563]|uniref:SHOCT domain-containing protein n=1 Tax=unclassified Phycicoccus TaxID=2637926 RepID=UPI000703B1C2|nr:MULTISPECIES: SHOCT domain-containing protein [unclassified Phycicoccus]KQU67511.1 hypothetical protein ASC58_13220 [Phycicoccus sp. Root101]KQZ90188.1 hypothetical protein ASD62_13680 [Phycicoccus sp. Root563]